MEMPIIIKPYTHLQLMQMYGVSWRTLKRWLAPYEKEIGPKIGHFYSVRQVAIIFRYIGNPCMPLARGVDN
jgi:hypothetical protein